jgi:hypothetical protein
VLRTASSTGWYTPTLAITRFLEAWRDGAVLTPITVDSLMQVGTPPSVAPRALRTLEGLGLVKDGEPTEDLVQFRDAVTEDQSQAVLGEVVKRAYADVFAAVGDPETSSEDELLAAFADYEPATQRDRMVGLFLGLCQFAGLVATPRRTGRRPRSDSTAPSSASPPDRRQRRGPTETRTVQLRSGPTVTLQVAGGLLGLPPEDLEFVFDLVRRIDEYERHAATRGNP